MRFLIISNDSKWNKTTHVYIHCVGTQSCSAPLAYKHVNLFSIFNNEYCSKVGYPSM